MASKVTEKDRTSILQVGPSSHRGNLSVWSPNEGNFRYLEDFANASWTISDVSQSSEAVWISVSC